MVKTRMDCSDVTILENIVKDVNPSDIFNEIEQLIIEMTEIIGKIRQNRETNSSSSRELKIIIENEIREVRTKINNHLDKLLEDLMKELTELEKTDNRRNT
jgi:exoribonuclease R